MGLSRHSDEDTGQAVLESDGGPLTAPRFISELGPFNDSALWETGKWRGLVFHVLPWALEVYDTSYSESRALAL